MHLFLCFAFIINTKVIDIVILGVTDSFFDFNYNSNKKHLGHHLIGAPNVFINIILNFNIK